MKNIIWIILVVSSYFIFTYNLHGQTKEKIKISEVLSETISKEGIQSAIQKYYKLKPDTAKYLITGNELINTGNKLIAEKKYTDALSVFDLVTSEYPKSYWGFYQSGRAYMASGQFDTAIEKFKNRTKLKNGLLRIDLFIHSKIIQKKLLIFQCATE